ncbi:MAG: NAD(P)/FAD-dependent oxidoreductase [Desulfobacteraceae bacterium]|nr:NAD(P)/FAD-dependent oxidoreductase [Desulfobacteraceae bacterium]
MLKDGEKGAILQRDKETYAVAPHIPCGVVSPDQLRTIADTAEKFNAAAIKITSAARVAIVGVKEEDIDSLWKDLDMPKGHAIGLCVRSVKACPGTAFCRLGQQDSLGMGMKLDKLYHGMDLPGKTKIGVSGCTHQCSENCIKDIGLLGRKKGWTLQLGGKGTATPRLTQEFARDLGTGEVLSLLEDVIDYYKKNAKKNERIGTMIDRLGLDLIKSELLDQRQAVPA